jgi:hypothetical protein
VEGKKGARRIDMDIREYNRVAWDREVERGNRWTIPVGEAVIAAARRGELSG